MAGVALENWVERIRDPKIECMSRDEMADLQSKRLVDVVKRVYDNVDFYRKKMQQRGVEPGDIKSIEDIEKLPFTTKEDLKNNYPFGLLAIPMKDVVRVQGTSGTTGKLTIAPYSQKDVEVWGECVARGLTMAGLTNEDIIHVCYGYGLFTGGMGLDFGDSDVSRKHKTSDDGHGGSWCNCICMYTFICFVSGRIYPGSRTGRPYETESRNPRRGTVD